MEKAVDKRSGSVLERPEVAHLLKAAAAALALLLLLSWSGRVALSPGLRWLLTVGTLVALVLGWKAFREGLAARPPRSAAAQDLPLAKARQAVSGRAGSEY